MKKSRFTNSQIIEPLKRAEAGLAVPELSRTGHQFSDVLHVACQVRRHGCLVDGAHKRAGSQECALAQNVRRRKAQGRSSGRGPCTKVLKPSRHCQMDQREVRESGISIRAACQAFRISQACYGYQAKLREDNLTSLPTV